MYNVCSAPEKMVKITDELFEEILETYNLWKELDYRLRKVSSRGVNIHEGISEVIVCYVNGFEHSVGRGSEDAFTDFGEQVQIKATSNYDDDLTSFGPRSEFDLLHFARLDKVNDIFYLYDIPLEELDETYVNSTQTFRDQQLQGRRPRFSIIKKIIIPQELDYYASVDLRTGRIIRK